MQFFIQVNGKNKNDESKWTPIPIKGMTFRGTISHYCEDVVNDVMKQESKKENANIQRVDIASLRQDADTLKMSFTLKVCWAVLVSLVHVIQSYSIIT